MDAMSDSAGAFAVLQSAQLRAGYDLAATFVADDVSSVIGDAETAKGPASTA